MKAKDLRGLKFGDLIVEAQSYKNSKGRHSYWLCKCVCGNYTTVSAPNLKSGSIFSCGCSRRRNRRYKDISGKRFHRLLVVRYIDNDSLGRALWECLCDCGNYTVVSGIQLRANKTKSCGCLLSETSKNIHTIHGQSYTEEYYRHKSQKRKELKKLLDSNWTFEMESLLTSLQESCVICESVEYLSTDHVYPLSLGNGLYPGNAVKLCRKCNSEKGSKLLDQLSQEKRDKIMRAAKDFENVWNLYKHGKE